MCAASWIDGFAIGAAPATGTMPHNQGVGSWTNYASCTDNLDGSPTSAPTVSATPCCGPSNQVAHGPGSEAGASPRTSLVLATEGP